MHFRQLLIIMLLGLVLAPSRAQVSSSRYSSQELETLVAPVALYPDTLLTHILTGATDPSQIQRAYTLSKSGVKSPAPKDMLPSVAALLEFPSVLAQMAENPDWTGALGYAMANQSQDIMRAVQQVRTRAYVAGNLKSCEQMTVQKQNDVIVISSPSPQVIYVPQYNPTTIYSPSPNAALLSFGVGMAVGSMFWSGACHWGSGFYYGPPGAYAGWAYHGYARPPGSAWYPRPTPYSGLPGYRPNVNNVHYNNVNINNVNVNNVNVNNRNNANVNRWNAPGTPPGTRPPGSRPPMPQMSGNGFQYERGVDARQASSRGQQSLSTRPAPPMPTTRPAQPAMPSRPTTATQPRGRRR